MTLNPFMAVSEIYLLWAQLSVYLPNHYGSHKVTNEKSLDMLAIIKVYKFSLCQFAAQFKSGIKFLPSLSMKQ